MATKTKPKPKAKKPAKAKKPKLTAAEQKEFEQRTHALTDEIKERRAKLETINAARKSLKEMLAGSEAELERVCFEFTHPESMPLFRDHANGKAERKTEPAPAAPPENEDWKKTPIREALKNMPKKFYELCETAQLDTIGKLMDWKNEREHRRWKDLGKGVGPATFDKLDDAIEAFVKDKFAHAVDTIGTEKPAEAEADKPAESA